MVGIAQADPRTGRFLAVNRRFGEIAGRPESELLAGLTFRDVTHPEDREADAAALEAALRTRGHYETEKRYLRRTAPWFGRRSTSPSSRAAAPGAAGRRAPSPRSK
jgi:PAS domain S-box-containing protein